MSKITNVGLVSDEVGTTSDTLMLDSENSGAQIKNSSGAIQIRNTDDDDYADIVGNIRGGSA